MKITLINRLQIIVLFSAIAPVLLSAILVFFYVKHDAELKRSYTRNYEQHIHFAVKNILQRIESVANEFIQSQELADFVLTPDSLKIHALNRVYGKISELRPNVPEVVEWMVLDREQKRVNFDSLKKSLLSVKTLPNRYGFVLLNEFYIMFLKKILFDDQNLSGPSAEQKGLVVLIISLNRIMRGIPELQSIESIPADLFGQELALSIKRPQTTAFNITYYFILLAAILLVSSVLGIWLVRKRILLPIKELTYQVALYTDDAVVSQSTDNEIELLQKIFEMYHKSIAAIQQRRVEQSRHKALAEQAAQVAHDVHSPLTALELAVKDLDAIPETERIMIRGAVNRIKDITHHLLSANSRPYLNDKKQSAPQLISSMIAEVVSEKRLEYRATSNDIGIHFDLDEKSYGLFAKVDISEFKVILSNLINNAIDAIEARGHRSGKATLYLTRSTENMLKIIVEDNGIGIPEKNLRQLTLKSQSFGKKNGHGMGLSHAKRMVKKWNGRLHIQTEWQKGTQVIVYLPESLAPPWFVQQLSLAAESSIIIVDDDPMIHSVWKRRLQMVNADRFNIQTCHYYHQAALAEDVEALKSNRRVLYLIDYEFKDCRETGIDLIASLRIHQNSILVTCRYEEKSVQQKCNELAIGMIPKMFADHIPIRPPASKTQSPAREKSYDVVYIDDDAFLRRYWTKAAEKKNINILALASPHEFPKFEDRIDMDTVFYIDRELGTNIKGEMFAKNLYVKGYKELFLSTEYRKSDLPDLPWLKGIIDKIPPF